MMDSVLQAARVDANGVSARRKQSYVVWGPLTSYNMHRVDGQQTETRYTILLQGGHLHPAINITTGVSLWS